MLNILHLINAGCDWYMVRHPSVSPLMPNQYVDMCNRTCFDRNVLLIKCDAVSAEIAVCRVHGSFTWPKKILRVYLYHLTLYRTPLFKCVTFNRPVDKDKWFNRWSLCIPTAFVTNAHKVDKYIEVTLFLKGCHCLLFYCTIILLDSERVLLCSVLKKITL